MYSVSEVLCEFILPQLPRLSSQFLKMLVSIGINIHILAYVCMCILLTVVRVCSCCHENEVRKGHSVQQNKSRGEWWEAKKYSRQKGVGCGEKEGFE